MILVTGAKGNIGSRLVSSFSHRGLEVTCLDYGDELSIQSDCIEADLTRAEHISTLKKELCGIKTVIHLAGRVEISLRANSSEDDGSLIPGKEDISSIYKDNVASTANVLDLCMSVGVDHLIFASSQTVYGMPVANIVTEESPAAPLEHYANSKLCCEQLLQLGAKQGMSVTALRIPGVYCETRKSGIVYKYCESASQRNVITVNADIPLPLDVIHVDDVVDAFEKAVQFGGCNWTCMNIATGEPCNVDLLADSVADLVPGCEVTHSKVSQPIVCMDSSKALSEMGWKAWPRKDRLMLILKGLSPDT